MNALSKVPMDGELLPPGATVRAVGKTHALSGGRIDCYVPAGLSITEMLLEALSERPDYQLRRDFIVHIDGHPIEEKNWSRVRLKAGATLTFMPRLQGSSMRTILSLVVTVAALIIAPYAAPSIISGLGAVGITVGVSTATALAAGGILLAGTLALNALFPVSASQPESVTSATLNSISGAQNQADPFGPVPVVLGSHRQSPRLGARWFTEIVGDDQFLRGVVCWGYGPLVVEDLRIGDTPISAYEDVQLEHRVGFPGDAPLSLYPGDVNELALSVQLYGEFQYQTTAPDTDEISLDFTATEGIYKVNTKTGEFDDYSVTLSVQYTVKGIPAWSEAGPLVFGKSTQVARKGIRIPVARGQYDVRVVQIGGKLQNTTVKDTIVWTALRSYTNRGPIAFPHPLALTAIRIRATNQLSGVINTLSGHCTSMVTAFTGAYWAPNQITQNPADLFRHVLQGPANARPKTDAEIDIENLQEWWAYCRANGFKFNQVRTSAGQSVADVLDDIAASGRAIKTFINGKYGVSWDRPFDSIVQHFTPRNSWGFQGQRPYAQQPHGWRASFINEKNGFTQDERIVYDDGYDASNATLFEGIQFPGVTDPDLIWKHGRYHIAQARLQPEKLSLSVGWEHLVCTRGDRVRVTHDVLLVGQASGRIKSVVGQVVTFDEVVTIEAGKTYAFAFRVPENIRSFLRSVDMAPGGVDLNPGEYTSLTLVGDLSLLKRGTLFGFGEAGQESAIYRVQGIAHQKDLVAVLTLVDDAPAIAMADQGEIPAYDPHVSLPVDPFTLGPQDLRYQPAVEGQGDAVRAITILTWQAPRRGRISASEVQYAEGAGGTNWQPFAVLPYPQFVARLPLITPGVWSFRLRFVFDDGKTSNWATLSNLTLLGLTGAPDDVQNVRGAAYVDDNTSLSWDEVIDYRPIRYAVRKGDSWESGLELGTIAHPPFAAHGNGTYLVKAYAGPDSARAYSVNPAVVEITGASLVRNVIAIRDEQADGWNGVFTGTVAKSGDLIRTGGSSDILSSPDFLAETDVINKGGQGDGTYEIAPSRYIDARRATACRVTITWKGTGQTATDDLLSNPDFLGSQDILAAGATDLVEVYPEISFAQNDVIGDVFSLDPADNPANDIFAEPDVFSADVSFSPWIKYEPGLYVGRYFRARLVLKTSDPQVVAIALKFTFSVDVPDRVDTWALIGGVGTSLNQITIPSTGLAIVFASNGKNIAEPFNGGPNTDSAPLIQITNTSSSNFDFEVQSLTKNGCTIMPRLAGTPTDAPKTNITIQGW
ncbi:MAG: phage tail protein [Bradyrhizobiaceae bacterium PARB1]|jgi:hypothetical protein|nr:MAG: phage tail protein [Bradyrhizobiaceae bacterium PARB1]